MKGRSRFLFFVLLQLNSAMVFSQFPPAAGQPGTTAISKDSSIFISWATTCEVVRGAMDISQPDLGNTWFGDAIDATGKAEGNSVDVVSLGDGGIATLFFETPVANGEGWDFAVFENALNDSFLELAFVEVSSDGVSFFRFPSVSNTSTDEQVATFGAIDPVKIDNFAGKYRQGFGTPFDLSQLEGVTGLDLQHISYVRIIDVVGSILDEFANYDSEGHKVNDPWPTPFETGGFDLDGVGVIHTSNARINESENLIRIFPVPFENIFNVSFDNFRNQDLDVEVLNHTGLIIYKDKIQHTASIDLSMHPAGLYFVKFNYENRIFLNKVLKIK
jgi:hypothetical protein